MDHTKSSQRPASFDREQTQRGRGHHQLFYSVIGLIRARWKSCLTETPTLTAGRERKETLANVFLSFRSSFIAHSQKLENLSFVIWCLVFFLAVSLQALTGPEVSSRKRKKKESQLFLLDCAS